MTVICEQKFTDDGTSFKNLQSTLLFPRWNPWNDTDTLQGHSVQRGIPMLKLPSITTLFIQLIAIAFALSGTSGFAQTLGRVETIVVHGASLEGNLDGDTPDRNVIIYLPPGYDTNSAQRYPVIYLLHGYGLRAESWMRFARIEVGANTAMTGSGGGVGTGERAREMIIVSPDAYTLYDGSMYGSSVATGDWEKFIAQDLVSYVDAHYRTLATRESRGLAGHSMGGYGTVRIGMKHPEVFSALYPLSACCAFDAGQPSEALTTAGQYTTRAQVAELKYPNKSTLARAASWSANPQNPPFFLDLPVTDGVENPQVQAAWLANSLLAMLGQYTLNLRQYSAIQFDVGLADGLLATNQQLDAAMTQMGIPHTFATYEGDHNNKVFERIETQVLPFFSKHLIAE
jgi:S-formylglutathione hydrolase FrmB